MRERHDPRTVPDALKEVVEAGQRVIIDRIELAVLDLKRSSSRLGLYAAGAVMMAAAWVALMLAIGALIGDAIGRATACFVVAAIHAAFGMVAFGVAARTKREVPRE
jgi:hypothetical protein